MKNSEKIWNLLQSPNTFEMGMELLETMVGIDPEIPYELFTQHNALEWFQNHKNIRFPQLILDGFSSMWESGDEAYSDCLTDTHSLSLVSVRQISQEHLDLFQNMPSLTLSVDWKGWLKLSKGLPSTLVADTFRLDCTECVVSMVDLLTQVECTHLEVEYPPKTIRVIGDCLKALPNLQTLRCGVGEGVLIWLYRNKDLVHSIQTIQTGREVLTFAEADGTLQERISSIKVSACVADQPEYNAAIYPNLDNLIVGDVLGDMVSFVRAHKDIPSMNVRQVFMKGINHYLYDVANRYGIEFGRSTSRPLEALPVLLYGDLPVMESVRAKIDVPLEVHRRLMKRELTLNVYNIEKVIESGKLSSRRLWDTSSLRVFYCQVLALFRLGATLSEAGLKILREALVNLTLRDQLDLLDLLVSLEEFEVYDVEGATEHNLMTRLVQTHFPEGLTFERIVRWSPNKQHIDSYKLWWKEWQSLSVQPSSIKHLEALERLGLSHELLDDAVLQLINRSDRSKYTVEWLLVRIQNMLGRGDLTLQRAEQLMDRALNGFENTISLTGIRLHTNQVSQDTVNTIFSLLLKHQLPCAPREFHHVMDRENQGASRRYGDWVVQQFTNLNELMDSHLRHIVGRLMKVLVLSNQSAEDQVKVLQQHFDPSYDTGWLYQPWTSKRALQRFEVILGEDGDEWLLQGVTGLFSRSKYVIRSIEQRISRMVSKGLWTEADREAFLCKQVSTSKKISRYIPKDFKVSLFYTLCRTGFNGLSTDRAISYFAPLDEVELTPEYRSVIKSVVLAWRGLFGGYWNRYSYSGEKLSIGQVHQYIQHLCQSEVITTQEYEDFVLANFQHQFTFSESIPLKVAKTLFGILKSRRADISKDLLHVYRLAQRWDLEVSQFDDHLIQTTSLFLRDTPLIMVSRVLWMASSGGTLSNGEGSNGEGSTSVLSPERYDALLLANFNSSFSMKSPSKMDASQKLVFKRLYAALFDVLKRIQPAIDDNRLNTLLEIAETYQLNPVQFDGVVFQSTGLLNRVETAERASQLYHQNAWSKADYQQALLESLKSISWGWWGKSELPSDLVKDLLDAIDTFKPELSTQRIQDLFELIEKHQWSDSLLDMYLPTYSDIFHAPKVILERVMSLVSNQVWTTAEYEDFLRLNFTSSFKSSYHSRDISTSLYQDLFRVLENRSEPFTFDQLGRVLQIGEEHNIDVPITLQDLLAIKRLFVQNFSSSVVVISKTLLHWKEDRTLTSQQYESILLQSFECGFSYSNRYLQAQKEMYTDLFEILNDIEVEISDRKLNALYLCAESNKLDSTMFDQRLLESTMLFTADSGAAVNRLSTLVDQGTLSPSQYKQRLLESFHRKFAFITSLPSRVYIDLLAVLNPANVEVSDACLKKLYEIAFQYGLDMSHWDERLLEYRNYFMYSVPGNMQERIQNVKKQYGQQRYDQFLLASFNKVHDLKPNLLSKGLYQDLLRALTDCDVEIPARKLNTLLVLSQKYNLDVSQFDGALRSVKDFFTTWSAEYVCNRVLTLVQQGQWSQEEYNTWLLTNFEQSSYIFSHTEFPKSVFQDLFGALTDCDVEIPVRKFNSLLELGQRYSLDVSQFDGVLRSMKDFFTTWSARSLCERVLSLVQQGEWSQEEYNAWLLANYNHKFTYSAWHHYDKQVYVDLFRCLMTVNEHDVSNLPLLARLQMKYDLDFGVIKHVLRNTSNAFQNTDRSLVNLVDKWREDQTINAEDFDALLQKSLPRLKYHWIIPESWYQRTLDLIDKDDLRIADPTLIGQLAQVLLKLGGYSTTVDRSILAISKNEGVPRLTLEVVPRYLLQRFEQVGALDVPKSVWFVRRKPTDDEVLQMVQYHQQGWTVFPTPHILQHMVHQIPNTPDGEAYLQDCVTYWCQETGKAWFEGWTMEQLLIGLRAVPNDIPQLDILGTQMEALPSECARFTQLQKLFVYNTGLLKIPQTLSLSSVEILSISNTALDLSQVLNLPSLKTLYCKNVLVSEEHQGQFEANGVELRF